MAVARNYRHVGSDASDLLNEQMERRKFSPEQQAAVHRTLTQLEESHHDALQALIAAGAIEVPAIIPLTQALVERVTPSRVFSLTCAPIAT